MLKGLLPENYEEWHHCITVDCGIPLNSAFIDERIAAMQDINDFKTRQFLELYGLQYHQQVMKWFLQAKGYVDGRK